MTEAQFQHLIDAHGADLTRWPAEHRAPAEQLVAADPAARAFLEKARRVDEMIARHVAGPPPDGLAARVGAALASKPLPRQRHRLHWSGWPSALLDWDYAPAWPRVGALASVAALGFLVGLVALDNRFAERAGWRASPPATQGDDLSGIVFEPEPLTGLRP